MTLKYNRSRRLKPRTLVYYWGLSAFSYRDKPVVLSGYGSDVCRTVATHRPPAPPRPPVAVHPTRSGPVVLLQTIGQTAATRPKWDTRDVVLFSRHECVCVCVCVCCHVPCVSYRTRVRTVPHSRSRRRRPAGPCGKTVEAGPCIVQEAGEGVHFHRS
jgi:hypothetical protein